jgi:hypothetical protein
MKLVEKKGKEVVVSGTQTRQYEQKRVEMLARAHGKRVARSGLHSKHIYEYRRDI